MDKIDFIEGALKNGFSKSKFQPGRRKGWVTLEKGELRLVVKSLAVRIERELPNSRLVYHKGPKFEIWETHERIGTAYFKDFSNVEFVLSRIGG